MRALATLVLTLTALTAQAETGPPTADELARAKADCAAKVQQACLLTLAIEAARTSTDAELLLNEIAFLQATAGDKAGAERTLSLTTPGFLALLALGREAEAQVAFEVMKLGPGVTMSKAKPPDPGKVALEKVEELVEDGKIDEALATALALPDDERIAQTDALRLIVDHHLARNDFAAAARVAKQMNATEDTISDHYVALTFNYSYTHPRADALVAVVKAQAASGDLAGAAALVGGLVDPRTIVNARIALADGYFKADRKTEAITQLDLILASVQRLELSNYFGLAELTASADLAFRNGETAIARQHAELAYKTFSKPTVRRGGENKKDSAPRTELLRLATVLQLVGMTGKGKALYAGASHPYPDGLLSPASVHNAALVVAQIRLGDPKAQDTIRQLLAKEVSLWSNGLHALHRAALELVELGLLQDALEIADQLELRLRDDILGLDGHDPAELYSAILAKDPDLAPQVLTDRLGPKAHFAVTLGFAETLHAASRTEEAQSLLQGLAKDHEVRSKTAPEFKFVAACAIRSITLQQERLGFTDDAEQSRQAGLAIATAQTDPTLGSVHLMILATSFPGQKAVSLATGMTCLEYP